MMPRLVIALSAAAVLGSCGPSDAALWLRIEAPLAVPADCDAIHIQVRRGGAAGPTVYDQTFALSAQRNFPLTLGLGSANDANLGSGGVHVTATALSAGQQARPWATRGSSVALRKGEVVELTMKLCDCP
jgi:hypothetical protein